MTSRSDPAARLTATLLAVLAATAPLHAQDSPAAGPPAAPAPPPEGFASRGPFSFTGAETADAIGDAAGGLARGVKLLSKTAVSAAYDGAQDGHEGLTGLVSAQYVGGGHISGANVGDIQTLDNIEAFSALRLYEAWLARDYDNRRGWKAGLVDLNVDFDTQEVAALFLNSSDGIGPDLSKSGLNGPSIYPTTALGLTAYVRPIPSLTLRAGLFDGTAGSPDHPGAFAIRLSGKDGALAILQADQRFGSGLRLEGGAWAYTAFFDAVNRVDAAGAPLRYQRGRGAYALVEGPLIRRGDDRGLSGWLRVGIADPVVEHVAGYLGGGLVYTGPLAARAQDAAGIAVNHAVVVLSGVPNAPLSAETAIELTYRYLATDWLAVQPDAQVIVHPGGERRVPDALVLGVRFSLTFTRTLAARLGVAASK
jgi:porin